MSEPTTTGEPIGHDARSGAGHDARTRRRPLPWAPLAAGVAVLGVLVWLAWEAGGYFPTGYATAGAIVFGVGGVLLLVHVPRYRLSTEALVGFGALAAFAAWTGLSSVWSPAPDAALEAMQRAIGYAGIFGLGLLAAGSGRHARYLVWGVLLAVLIVVGAGLLSRLHPDVIGGVPDVTVIGEYRLGYPFTYWNAFGALAAFGAVLAFGLAADPRTAAVLRAAAAGATVLLFVAMYLSFSRGAWLALIVGVAVLLALGANRGSLLLTAGLVGGACLLALLRLRAYPALIDDPVAGSGQEKAGDAFTPQLLILVAAAVGAQAVIAAGRASETVMEPLRRASRPVGIALTIVVALFAIAAYGLRAGSLEGWTAARLDDTSGWVGDQWDQFLQPTTAVTETGSARLTTAKGTRSDLYRIAFDAFEGHPIAGEGAGSYEHRFIAHRRVGESVRNAHSLELETLGELGAIGALLLLAFLGSLGSAAVRARRKPGGLSRSQVAAVGAACSVWVFHSAVDWDWQMPALTGMALVLGATLYPYGRRRRRRRQ